uniref:Uncharacterized protein n=1 Tax=Oryza punctata TaxID=4537 RepID=A0A0E0JV65_ORYPU
MATSSPIGGLHLQADRLRRYRVTSSPCRMATSSPTRGLHLQAGRLRRHRDATSSSPGVYFVTDWELTPPSQPPTPPLGDIVPVQDGHFIADWACTSSPAAYAVAG